MGKFKLVVVLGAMVSLVIGGNIRAEEISVPYPFRPETTIRSSEMNANFDTVYGQVNKIGSVINVDPTKKHLAINTTASEVGSSSAALIVSAPHGSDQSQGTLWLMNSTLPQDNLGHIAGMSKRSDGSLGIYGYVGGSQHTNQYAPISFHRNGTSSGEVMRIHSNGNVGIGTTAPEKICIFGQNQMMQKSD